MRKIMSLNCGIVGLPNVGKSTIFSALTCLSVKVENYPFCTIEPNLGIVEVPDERLTKIADILNIEKRIPATVEFVDIAGLVEGASKGEGLGNQFLSHIREVNVIIHIVRCFENPDVSHPYKDINPTRDIDVINMELILADLQTVENRLQKNKNLLKSQDQKSKKDAQSLEPLLEKLQQTLNNGKPVKSIDLKDGEKKVIKDLNLLTAKEVLYVCNIDEKSIERRNKFTESVENYAKEENIPVIEICGKDELEIAAINDENERIEFMKMLGLEESALDKLIKTAYNLLGLETFFTENGKEVRAWMFKKGTKAPDAAGIIHTDFQKGFIKAEVYHSADLFEFGSKANIKEHGKTRTEGKNYEVRDGDVILFHFNV
jgi:GTP-binding protein YchF